MRLMLRNNRVHGDRTEGGDAKGVMRASHELN
jgi:hypothetical protein